MNNKILFIVTIGSLISLIGTMAGASLGILIKEPSNKNLGIINAFAGGLMFSVVIFDLLPEAINQTNIIFTVFFGGVGILMVILIDKFYESGRITNNVHKKVAFMAALGLMIHNFPEGIIMGVGFVSKSSLGIKMSLIIAIHDIPEGIAVAAPLMASRVKPFKILVYAFITAFPTVIGAWVGAYIGNISTMLIGESLAFASGIMIYVVWGEMIPEAFNLWKSKKTILGILFGVLTGVAIISIL